MAKIYVGMGGFSYPGWKNSFYPSGLSAKQELTYASRKVTSIEINASFYRYQTPTTYSRWYEETPADFRFAIKGPKVLTHDKRLQEPESSLANFLASGLLKLGEKMGPILWQFPPFFPFKEDRFAHFFEILPRDFFQAAAMARNHSERMQGKVFVDPEVNYPLRHAFEFRHPSFQSEQVVKLLKAHGHGLVFAHSPKAPAFYAEDLCSDFVYLRIHGNDGSLPQGRFDPEGIAWFAQRAKLWCSGKSPKDAALISQESKKPQQVERDVYIYFDLEAKDYAPSQACELLELLNKGGANKQTSKSKKGKGLSSKKAS